MFPDSRLCRVFLPARAFDFVGLKKDEILLREGVACCNVHDEADWISDSSYRLPSSFRRARLKLKGAIHRPVTHAARHIASLNYPGVYPVACRTI
jgi:hypothetical protein